MHQYFLFIMDKVTGSLGHWLHIQLSGKKQERTAYGLCAEAFCNGDGYIGHQPRNSTSMLEHQGWKSDVENILGCANAREALHWLCIACKLPAALIRALTKRDPVMHVKKSAVAQNSVHGSHNQYVLGGSSSRLASRRTAFDDINQVDECTLSRAQTSQALRLCQL